MASEDYRRSQESARSIAMLERRIEALERGAPLRSGGVGAGGITIKGGSLRILAGGNLEVDGDASFTGDTNIGGNLSVVGTLSLPAGIINNDALANPLQLAEAEGDADGFSIGEAATNVVSCQIPVPSGFTRALVVANGTCTAYNAGDTTSVVYSRVYVRGNYGRRLSASASPEARRTSMSPMKQDVLTGLSGGSITCTLEMSATVALGPANANGASLNAYAIFSR